MSGKRKQPATTNSASKRTAERPGDGNEIRSKAIAANSNRVNGHVNGSTLTRPGQNQGDRPSLLPSNLPYRAPAAAGAPSQNALDRRSRPAPEPREDSKDSISKSAVNNDRSQRPDQRTAVQKEVLSRCSVPATTPLSTGGRKYAFSSLPVYPNLYDLLVSYQPIEFNSSQLFYASRGSQREGDAQNANSLIERGVLLVYSETHRNSDTANFFRAVHTRKPKDSQYQQFLKEVDEMKALFLSDKIPGAKTRTNNRHGKAAAETKSSAQEFFTVAKVFAYVELKPGRQDDASKPSRTRSRIRRMVVVREGEDGCVCLPIVTNGGRGVLRREPAASDNSHAIIFDSRSHLDPNRLQGEPEMTKSPIAIDLANEETLDRACRLCFSKPVTVPHNIRAAPIGIIAERSMARFRQYVKQELGPAYEIPE